MPIGDHTPRSYQPGQIARIGVELADPDGISGVAIMATNTNSSAPEPRTIRLDSHGSGTSATVVVSGNIKTYTPPGTYRATEALATDVLGNRSTVTLPTPVEFTVSHPGGMDSSGPTVGDWGFEA